MQSGRTPSCTEWEMSPYVPTRNKYWQELCARKNSYHMSGLLTLSLPPPSSDSKNRVFYVTGILYCFSAGFRFENSFFSLMDDRGYRPAMLNCKKKILSPCLLKFWLHVLICIYIQVHVYHSHRSGFFLIEIMKVGRVTSII